MICKQFNGNICIFCRQNEARKTFSHYLVCILKRIVAGPEQDDHAEIVLKFLQKASDYLRTPFNLSVRLEKLICFLNNFILKSSSLVT